MRIREICEHSRAWLAACLLSLVFTGCQHQEGLLTRAQVSYLVFLGNAAGTVASIDDGPVIPLTADHVHSKTRFSVEPGQHRVRVERAGATVVNRVVLLVDQQAVEIPIP